LTALRSAADTVPGAVFDVLAGQDHVPADDVLEPALTMFFQSR